MEVNLPDHLKCPVCSEIPAKEIYQCLNGHTICSHCSLNLSNCPQCRANYGPSKIRNRAAEDLLDLMKFECSFKDKGCTQKLSRKDVSTHLEDCDFGGESVTLCKNLGYDCNYVIKMRRVEQALVHLRENHAFITTSDQKLQITLQNITKGDRQSKTLWNPIIITADNINIIVLTFSNISVVSFFCLCIGNSKAQNFQVDYNILGRFKDVPALQWRIKPIDITKSDNFLQANPFRFPLDLFQGQYMEKDDLVIKLSLTNVQFKKPPLSSFKSITPSKVLFIPLQKKVPNESSATLLMNKGTTTRKASNDKSVQISTQISTNSNSRLDVPLGFDLLLGSFCAICSLCSNQIMINQRHKCLQCPDFNLCTICIAIGQHSQHVFAILQNNEQNREILKKLGGNGTELPYSELGNQQLFDDESLLATMFEKIDVNVRNSFECANCDKTAEFVCLVCPDAKSFCEDCFQDIMDKHNTSHYFAIAKNVRDRETIVEILCKNNLV